MKKPKKIKVLGICAGNGVCLFPFHSRKKFKVIGNVEPRQVFHTKNEEQWNLNFENVPFEKEIKPYFRKFKPDVIIGHPDCGDSSALRLSRAKKRGNVKDNSSVNLFIQSINLYQPATFLLENLPLFLKTYTLEYLNDIFEEQYDLWTIEGSVALFGNSQVSRKRLVLIGLKKGQKLLSKKALTECLKVYEHTPKAAEYFELPLTQMVEVGHYRELPNTYLSLYHPPTNRRTLTVEEAQKLWAELPPSVSRWPVGGKMKNQPGVSRHSPGKPPLTVRKQNRQFSTLGLPLSPREMANIQGVSSLFKIYVDLRQRVYWLNKNRVTVTKCMPYEIAQWYKKAILRALNS